MLARILSWLDGVVKLSAGCAIAATAIITCLEVFFREVLGSSLQWQVEVTGNLLVWTSFLGAYMAVRDDSHIGFDLLIRKLPGLSRRIAYTLIDISVLFLMAILVKTSIRMISVVGGTSLQTVDIPVGTFMAAIPVCAGLMAIALLGKIVDRWIGAEA